MNDDYLWDRTGEPDPEIQQLEEVLGTLRYQPRPLEIPAGLQVGRERRFFRGSAPRLAIAATIAMLLLGLGLWLAVQRLQRNRRQEVVRIRNTPQAQPNPASVSSSDDNRKSSVAVPSPGPDQKRTVQPGRHRVNQALLAGNTNHDRNARVNRSQLTAQQLQEAEAAKGQLMLALRVASAKLNYVQKKTQDLNQREPVHNQHRIG